jgi:DNA processing protein
MPYSVFIQIMNTLSKTLALLHAADVGPFRLAQWGGQRSIHTVYEQMFKNRSPDKKKIERDLRWASKDGHHIIMRSDKAYPYALSQIEDAPALLFVRGDLSLFQRSMVAVVGARKAGSVSEQEARRLGCDLSLSGCVVVSGLAYGVDAAAHRGALDASSPTVAVLAGGLDRVYPVAHQSLADKLLDLGGALVSEQPLGQTIKPYYFPKRNRIISGLSQAVVLVACAIRSGSMTTAAHAADQGREVFAFPGRLNDPMKTGCHRLIREGAGLATHAQDVLSVLRPIQSEGVSQALSKTHSHLDQAVCDV